LWKKVNIHASDVYGRNSQPKIATSRESKALYQFENSHTPIKNIRGPISAISATRQQPPIVSTSHSGHGYVRPTLIPIFSLSRYRRQPRLPLLIQNADRERRSDRRLSP
jgi:hypothetical protein